MEIYIGSEGLSNVAENKQNIEKLSKDNATNFQSIEKKINDNQNNVETQLLQKVDTITLESNYSDNSQLKKQLLEKADKTALETAIQKRLVDFQSLLNSITETEAKIDDNYESLMNSVNEVKDSLFTKIQDLTNVMNSTSTELTSKITDVSNNANTAKQDLVQSDTNLNEKIVVINKKIPSTASETNQLVDKNYVDDLVLNNSANPITSDVDGSSFASFEALKNGPWYSLGVEANPSKNDYAIVKSDALHSGNDVRYNYDGNGWVFFQEFKQGSSNLELTTNQTLAINSGITSDLVNQITTNKTNLEAEIAQRTLDKSDLLLAVSNEGNYRLKTDNEILQQLALEQNTRESKDLEILTKISEHEKTTSVEHNTIKKIISDNKAEIEATIGSITNLNTDIKSSIVEGINNLRDEMHNERVAKTGDTMTGKLSFELVGSGTPISLAVSDDEGNIKGVDLTIDVTSGYMNMIPRSRNDLGFEVSALSFSPRNPGIAPTTLGTEQKKWSNIYVEKINSVDVISRINEVETNFQTKDNEILQQIQNEIDNRDLADQNLQANITAEETARTAKDTELETNLTQEIADRKAADGDLTTLKTESKDDLVKAINSIQRTKIVTQTEYNQMVIDGTVDNEVIYQITNDEVLPVTDNQFKEFFDKVYPIGSIYFTMDDVFSPATAFGGTWEKIETGRYLRAVDTGAGTEHDETLPNIIGEIGQRGGTNTNRRGMDGAATGAFSFGNAAAAYSGAFENQTGYSIKFNANSSSAVYQDGAKVMPDSIDVIMWRRIA